MSLMSIKNLSFTYGKGFSNECHVLDDITFSISMGEFIGLIGSSGAGKTTLVKHLNGLLRTSAGHITFKSHDIADKSYKIAELRRSVGLVFQYPEHQLFKQTVLDDVAFGPENLGDSPQVAREKAIEALKLLDIGSDFAKKSPFDLSGGEMRRVAIAGVLAMNPQLLMLDEPTAGLDPYAKYQLLDLLSSICKKTKTTILLISHNMEDIANYARRVLVLEQGRLLFDDTPSKVFQQVETLSRINVGVPEITKLSHMIRQQGLSISSLPVTVEEAVKCFSELLGNKPNDK